MPCLSGHIIAGCFYKNSVLMKVKWFNNEKCPNKGWSGVGQGVCLILDNASSHSLTVVRMLRLSWDLKTFYFRGLRKCFLERNVSQVLLAASYINFFEDNKTVSMT